MCGLCRCPHVQVSTFAGSILHHVQETDLNCTRQLSYAVENFDKSLLTKQTMYRKTFVNLLTGLLLRGKNCQIVVNLSKKFFQNFPHMVEITYRKWPNVLASFSS